MLPYPCDQYVELMNWQIPDKSVIETNIADNSHNDAIFIFYLNGELSLETGWERNDNFTSSSWGNNTNSIANSGWVANSSSNESIAGVSNPTYILLAFELSDRSEIPIDLKDDLICLIIRNIFKDPVLANDGHTYDRDYITTWLEKSKKSPLTNEILDNNILNSNIILRKLLMNLAARTPQEYDTIKTQEFIKAKRNNNMRTMFSMKQNITVQKLLMNHVARTTQEVDTIKTQEFINIDIHPETILKGQALWHENNDLSAGHVSQQEPMHASRYEPNDLSPGHAS